jgi:MFS transporter, DHA2 family, methylenomycin A resistance protein
MIHVFGAAVTLIGLFVLRERCAEQPMLPLSLFRNHVFARTTLIGLVVNIPLYGLIFIFSLYFQKINGLSALATGWLSCPMMAAVLPVNLLAPRLAERFGGPATVATGAILSAAACLALLGIEPGTSYWVLCVPLIGMGCGIALSVPPLTSALLGSLKKSRSGVAAGVLNSARQTGSVLGVALFGSLIGQMNDFISGARAALAISTLLLVGAAATTATGRRPSADPRRLR